MQVLQLEVGGFDHNFSYLAVNENAEALLVDPTGTPEALFSAISGRESFTLRYVLLTHGHPDHMENLDEVIRRFPEADICGHPDNPRTRRSLGDGEKLPFADGEVEVLFTPGHSRDSVCYLLDQAFLFTGDTLFVDCVGFTRRPAAMYSSLRRLAKLPGEVIVYPGHDYGGVPFRTLEEEIRLNPYLSCRNLEAFKNKLRELI